MKIPVRQIIDIVFFKAKQEFFFFLILIMISKTFSIDWKLEMGTGYSLISQEYVTYRYDLEDTLSYDLLEEDTLTIDNRLKAIFDLDMEYENNSLDIDNQLYSTAGSESFYIRNKLEFTWKLIDYEIDLEDRFEFKTPWKEESSTREYLKNQLKAQIAREFKFPYSAKIALKIENKDYTDEYTYSYDYTIIETDAYFDYASGGYINYEYIHRYVPDSSSADYDQHKINISYDYYKKRMSNGTFYGSYANRTFNDSPEADYQKFFIEARPRLPISEKIGIQPGYELEKYDYKKQNTAKMDYDHHSYLLSGIYGITDDMEISAGGQYLIASADTNFEGETYEEFSFPISCNYFSTSKFWIDITIEPGWRLLGEGNQDVEFSFYSDYFYTNIDAMATYKITKKIDASLFGYYSPQWHDVSSHDFTMSYLSLTLKYEF